MLLEERVSGFIRQHGLVAGTERLVVAVSGGPDSVCLLHVLCGLAQELGLTLHAAHLNHRLRGAEADADAAYVAELAGNLGVPVTIEARDVRAYRVEKRLSLEEAAREVRYGFLAGVVARVGAGRVAVGHTADDQVETVLMHLVRGSGTRGLRGLQPVTVLPSVGNSLTLIRPLLEVSRQETVEYCSYHRLNPRTDTSNRSLSPLRNRLRRQLLPLLRRYNPGVEEALRRTARIAAEDIAFLDGSVASVWGETVRERGGTIVLDKERFRALPAALQRNLLRLSIERLLGNIKDIEWRHIDIIMEALEKPAGRRFNLPSGLIFTIDYNSYQMGLDYSALCPFPVLGGETALNIPGETSLPGWRVTAAVVAPDAVGKGEPYQAWLDLDRVDDKLTVRSRRPGDRFQPLGMADSKKLNEFMIDAKIPRPWRGRVPLVCSPDHIVWVVGWRLDERVRVTGDTRRALCLEFTPT